MEEISIKTDKPIAYDSPDHITPWGTRRDSSRNHRFNNKLYAFFPRSSRIKILDMGCSGGGFVRDCFEDGMLAVGLEGSDYSKKFKRAEWRFIPEYLFTCDVTSPFELFVDSGKEKMPLLFDVVTSWELIEHIAQKDLPAVINNVKRHLVPNGMWILSVSMNHDIIDGVDLHQTVQKKRWWIAFFEKYGLRNNPQHVRYFQDQFIRGPRYGAPNSFHLVLTRNAEIPPLIPRQKLTYMIYDAWHNSFLNRLIKTFLIGK